MDDQYDYSNDLYEFLGDKYVYVIMFECDTYLFAHIKTWIGPNLLYL